MRQNQMPARANGEEFANALNDGQNDNVENRHKMGYHMLDLF